MNLTRPLVATALLLGALWLPLPVAAQDDPISVALREADALAEQGRFREALARLERDAAAHRRSDPEGWEEHGPRTIELYRKLAREEQRFEAADAAARRGDTTALVAWVREVEGGKYPHARYTFVDRWKARARQALGAQAYQKIVDELEAAAVQGLDLDVKPDEDPDEGPTREEVKRRGDPARRQHMRAAARVAMGEVSQHRLVLGAATQLRAAKLKKSQDLALGKDVDGAAVARWDERGFALTKGGQETAHGWDEADPALAVRVRALGVAADDAQGFHDLALFALERGRFEEAGKALAEATLLDPTLGRADLSLDKLRRLAQPFRGAVTEKGAALSVTWAFDQQDELRDVAAMSKAQAELVEGALKVKGEAGVTFPSLLRVRGQWSTAVEVDLQAPGKPVSTHPLLVGLSCGAARVLFEVKGGRARVLALGRNDFEEVAGADVPANPVAPLRVSALFDGTRLHARLDVDGQAVLQHSLEWVEPTEVLVGTRGGGEVRLESLAVRGVPRPGWLEEARGAGVGEVVRALTAADDARRTPGLPSPYWVTSAEDALGVADISTSAMALVQEGRDLLQGGAALAKAAPKFMVAARAPEYAAAVYLEGRARLDAGDVWGALERADMAMRHIEDFHEAMTLKATALLSLWRTDEATKLLEEAAALGPAHPALWLARSDLRLLEGKLAAAREACALASVLAPECSKAAAELRALEAVVAGPLVTGSTPLRGGLTLVTDLPEAERARLVVALDDPAKLPELLARTLPSLATARPARPHRAVVLASRAAFHRWLARRGLVTHPETVQHVEASTGDVVALHEPGRTAFLLRRALVLTWLEEQGLLGLPRWVRGGLAGVLGDVDDPPARGPSVQVHRLRTLAVGWPRRPRLFEVGTQADPAAEKALPDLTGCMSWAFMKLCLDPEARGVLEDGQQVPLSEVLADFLRRVAQPAPGTARLEHAWVETFYRLDPADLDARLLAKVRALAAEQGVPFPH